MYANHVPTFDCQQKIIPHGRIMKQSYLFIAIRIKKSHKSGLHIDTLVTWSSSWAINQCSIFHTTYFPVRPLSTSHAHHTRYTPFFSGDRYNNPSAILFVWFVFVGIDSIQMGFYHLRAIQVRACVLKDVRSQWSRVTQGTWPSDSLCVALSLLCWCFTYCALLSSRKKSHRATMWNINCLFLWSVWRMRAVQLCMYGCHGQLTQIMRYMRSILLFRRHYYVVFTQ